MRDIDQAHEQLAATLQDAFAASPDPAARERTRARLLDAAVPVPRRASVRRRLVLPLAAVFLVLSATGAAALPLSADALPGDALFGVRMATERLRIAFASNPGDEAQVRLAIARARTADIERALARGRDEAVSELARRFFEQLRAAEGFRANVRAQDASAARIAAIIEARRARFDAITARFDTPDRIQDGGRNATVIRNLRKHDDRTEKETDRGSGRGNDRGARGGANPRPLVNTPSRSGGREQPGND